VQNSPYLDKLFTHNMAIIFAMICFQFLNLEILCFV